ncbi:helix-turn-helix transcriptional regulator [Magnetovibrio blakemorei]|uniref:helix-turn-helix transcriptional regulator n=1 Tax=Magnetovibrio blakemorei TaxID=28181 RepID=UPI0009FE3F59|nr:helix-turn-helix domain-containing protein [Magnetovibrio blakemorei]
MNRINAKRINGTINFGNLLTPREAATRLSVSVQTLAHWRVRGAGPAFISLSARCIRYPESTLDDWLGMRLQSSTAENDN